ncbi:hypothetical protein HYV84_05450 [Candidatus Woesearchaeota archaeon]|nr:hypothetical protein [Candidatus Woesearchaeota archaeon]
MRLSNNAMGVIAVSAILLSFWSSYVLVNEAERVFSEDPLAGTGNAIACITSPPRLEFSCPSSAKVGERFLCDVDGYDEDAYSERNIINKDTVEGAGGIRFSFEQAPIPIDPATGLISFIPTKEMVGNRSYTLIVSDGSGCPGGMDTKLFLLEVVP